MTVQRSEKRRPFRHRGKLLFCCALLLGLLLVLLIPPFDSPDELTHFQNVWAIGHGQVFSGDYWAEGKLSLPAGFAPLMREYPVRLIGISNQEKCSWGVLLRQSMEYIPTDKMMSAEGRIFSLGYLFSAFGMALAKLHWGDAKAIIRAHNDYRKLKGRYVNHPDINLLKSFPGTERNIVIDYYLLGKKKF